MHMLELLHDDSPKALDELRTMWDTYRTQAGFPATPAASLFQDEAGAADASSSASSISSSSSDEVGAKRLGGFSNPDAKKQRHT